MISFHPSRWFRKYHQIRFSEERINKIVFWLSRAANTHHDKELTDLLDKLREVK